LTAEKGSKLVKVKVEPLSPTILTIDEAIHHSSYYESPLELRHGNIEEALKESDQTLEGEMRVGAQVKYH
jgi:xanthine dehydrogenase molybdopterin-binding subunit B